MPKVSVIIPVYNVEEYLRECLDSVVNQTLQDIEIICVNDGSPDNSLAILEEYAKKDERIRIINKENGGVSSARNIGIRVANSNYLIFVDSDDTIDLDTCRLALEKIVEVDADICCFGVNEKYNNQVLKRKFDGDYLEKYEGKEIDLSCKVKFLTNACGKIIKRDFLINNSIEFPPLIKTGEDSIFNLNCLFKEAKFTLLNKYLYYYLMARDGAVTTKLKEAVANDIEGYNFFINSEVFKQAPDNMKIVAIDKFLAQLHYYYTKPTIYRFLYFVQIMHFRKFLFNEVSFDVLSRTKNLKYINPNILNTLIFSLINYEVGLSKYKIITILGLIIKIKRR